MMITSHGISSCFWSFMSERNENFDPLLPVCPSITLKNMPHLKVDFIRKGSENSPYSDRAYKLR